MAKRCKFCKETVQILPPNQIKETDEFASPPGFAFAAMPRSRRSERLAKRERSGQCKVDIKKSLHCVAAFFNGAIASKNINR